MTTDNHFIFTKGCPILNNPCQKIDFWDKKEWTLAQEISTELEQCYNELNGKAIGLAAPQIGYPYRICIVQRLQSRPLIMINPRIVQGSTILHPIEECLSIPGSLIKTNRYERIKVEYRDQEGQLHVQDFSDLTATIIQHEIDHLNGRLIDRKWNADEKD